KKHHIRNGESKYFIGFIKQQFRLFIFIIQVFSHSNKLRSLPGKNKSVRHNFYFFYFLLIRSALIKLINSCLVVCFSNSPKNAEVVVTEFCFWTPRIIMHKCSASI